VVPSNLPYGYRICLITKFFPCALLKTKNIPIKLCAWAITLKRCIREVLRSNLGRYTEISDWGFRCFSSVPSVKCEDTTSIRSLAASQIPCNSSFISNLTMLSRIVIKSSTKNNVFEIRIIYLLLCCAFWLILILSYINVLVLYFFVKSLLFQKVTIIWGVWLYTGYGLDIGFTDHLSELQVTTAPHYTVN
jgi:hypothetical protein